MVKTKKELYAFYELTLDDKTCGLVKTTIPPNNVINRVTKVMSFKKSICGRMIEIGSKIC